MPFYSTPQYAPKVLRYSPLLPVHCTGCALPCGTRGLSSKGMVGSDGNAGTLTRPSRSCQVGHIIQKGVEISRKTAGRARAKAARLNRPQTSHAALPSAASPILSPLQQYQEMQALLAAAEAGSTKAYTGRLPERVESDLESVIEAREALLVRVKKNVGSLCQLPKVAASHAQRAAREAHHPPSKSARHPSEPNGPSNPRLHCPYIVIIGNNPRFSSLRMAPPTPGHRRGWFKSSFSALPRGVDASKRVERAERAHGKVCKPHCTAHCDPQPQPHRCVELAAEYSNYVHIW